MVLEVPLSSFNPEPISSNISISQLRVLLDGFIDSFSLQLFVNFWNRPLRMLLFFLVVVYAVELYYVPSCIWVGVVTAVNTELPVEDYKVIYDNWR